MDFLLVVYVATRLISPFGYDTLDVSGWADVMVGNEGEIASIDFSAVEQPCDDGTIQFSPAPPECVDLGWSSDTETYTADGRLYQFANGRAFHVLRRGSVETGDPSLIVMLEDGTVVFYREVVPASAQ